jgi:hypothetical protein
MDHGLGVSFWVGVEAVGHGKAFRLWTSGFRVGGLVFRVSELLEPFKVRESRASTRTHTRAH